MPAENPQPIAVPVEQPIEKRLAAAVARYGEATVVARAISLIAGNNEGEDFLLYLGGEHARGVLNGAPPLYWPELWGTRALLYVWDDSAVPAVDAALANQAWRVREMACRVVAFRAVSAGREVTAASERPVSEALVPLLADEVPRVRAAAARALGDVGSASRADDIRSLLKDPEIDVRRGAENGLTRLRSRFPPELPET